MTATNATYLPTYEELYVEPLNITSAALKAGAPFMGVYCDKEHKEFMLCKSEEKDPRKCLKYGKDVSACASKFFKKVRDTCAESFTDYWKCLDNAPRGQMHYNLCRKTQEAFDVCMKEKMSLPRPEIGWLSKVKLFDSERPRPVQKYTDINVALPEPPQAPKDPKDLPPVVQDSLLKTKGRLGI